MKMNVWDKLSNKYDTLWVQKYSLTPSRNKVLALLNNVDNSFSLLDVGCATGQLLCEIREKHPKSELFGIDKSENMIDLAKEKNKDIEFSTISVEDYKIDKKFDFITCCHSLPYYPDKDFVLKKLSGLLKEGGMAIFVQASINSGYDKFAMSIVEKTAEKADYLSKKEFCNLAGKYFVMEDSFTIKEKWFMPSICGFVLGKKL